MNIKNSFKKTKSKTNKRSLNLYFVDGGFLLLTLLFSFLDGFVFKLGNQINRNVSNIIVVLLPTIITIVSIVLSLTKAEIYGVKLHEFNILRGKWTYSFLRMVICVIVLFLSYSILMVFEIVLPIYILEGIAVYYSFYFSIQEIPLLLNNNSRIIKILKNYYKNHDKSEMLGSQNKDTIFYTVLENIVFTKGIFAAYSAMSEKCDKEYNSTLLHYLLEIQNTYLFEAIDNIEFIKTNINGSFRGISLLEAIDMGFSNLKQLLMFNDQFNYKTIITSYDETYQLARSYFSLHKICNLIGFVDKEKNELRKIISPLFLNYHLNKANSFDQYSFLIVMSIWTLPEGELWFIKAVRDNDYASFGLFSEQKRPIGLFLSILMAYVVKMFPQTMTNIKNFVNERSEGLNSDGATWKQMLLRRIEYSNPHVFASSLGDLLKIYDSVNPSTFENIFIKKSGLIQDYKGFTKNYLFNAWIETILFVHPFYFTSDEIRLHLDALNEDEKRCLAYYLPQKWITNGTLSNDIKLEFLNLFDESYLAKNANVSELVEVFVEFHNKYFTKYYDEKLQNISADIQLIKEEFIKAFEEYETNEFFDASIDLSGQEYLSYDLRIDGFEIGGLVEAYAKSVVDSLALSIRDEISKFASAESLISVSDDFELTDESLRRIKQLKPEFTGISNSLPSGYRNDEILSKIKIIDDEILPTDFYGKNGCFKFRIQLDKEKTVVRYLKPSEIETIIDRDYTKINGRYKYSEYKDDKIKNVLLTREELIKYLSKSIIFVQLVFRQKIVLINGKYLMIKEFN